MSSCPTTKGQQLWIGSLVPSFPSLAVLQAMESWTGSGNKANGLLQMLVWTVFQNEVIENSLLTRFNNATKSEFQTLTHNTMMPLAQCIYIGGLFMARIYTCNIVYLGLKSLRNSLGNSFPGTSTQQQVQPDKPVTETRFHVVSLTTLEGDVPVSWTAPSLV